LKAATQTIPQKRTKPKAKEIIHDLPPRPSRIGEESIDYALICKEMGRYDEGLDVLDPVIQSGNLSPENWRAYALAGFFNLQRGDSSVCRKLMKQAVLCVDADRTYFNCTRTETVYNHFAYHFDYQLLDDIHKVLRKRTFKPVVFEEVAVSSEGLVFLTEALGRKILSFDTMGNFMWGKSLNLAGKNSPRGIPEENLLMSCGYGEGITIIDNATGDMMQMNRQGSFDTIAPLGSRFFKVHSFTQDYFGCIFVTELNPMRLSIYEPDGKLQREIFLDEVMDYNRDVNPFTIIYDEEGYLHLYNIDVLLTLNGEGRKIFRKDFVSNVKSRKDWKIIRKGLAIDSSGRIYLTRPSENRILVIDKTIGTELGEIGPDLAQTKLRRPTDVAVDLDDNIYINDSGNARILKIDSRSNDVTTLFHLSAWKFMP
jgi:hypothetical protein